MLQPRPEWLILDASKMQTFLKCPRLYFYEHILGWRSEEPNHHLEFGRCFHLAMEHILLHPNEVDLAYDRFLAAYRETYTEASDSLYTPKDPGHVRIALAEFAERPRDYEVVATEIPLTVALTEDLLLCGVVDALCRDRRGLFPLDHKTSSRKSRGWIDQWALKTQPGLYVYGIQQIYDEPVWGYVVNGVFFYKNQKKPIDFEWVPVEMTPERLSVWHEQTHFLAESIRLDTRLVQEDCYDRETMPATIFPMNSESCTPGWGVCQFHDFCMAWPNPLKRCETVPVGMVQEFWNPLEREERADE